MFFNYLLLWFTIFFSKNSFIRAAEDGDVEDILDGEEAIHYLLNRCFNDETWMEGPPTHDELIYQVSDWHEETGWYYVDVRFQVTAKTRLEECHVELNLNPRCLKGSLISRHGVRGDGPSLNSIGDRRDTWVKLIITDGDHPRWQLNWNDNGLIGKNAMRTFIHTGINTHADWSGNDVWTNTPYPSQECSGTLDYRTHEFHVIRDAIDIAEKIEDTIRDRCVILSEASVLMEKGQRSLIPKIFRDQDIVVPVVFIAACFILIVSYTNIVNDKREPRDVLYGVFYTEL